MDALSTHDPEYAWFQPTFLNPESSALTIKPYPSHLSVLHVYGFLIRFQWKENDKPEGLRFKECNYEVRVIICHFLLKSVPIGSKPLQFFRDNNRKLYLRPEAEHV